MMILVLCFSGGVSAQNERRNAVPENGFWEVITDEAHPRLATVRFYDLSAHLVYEEKVTGVKLDIRRRRIREELNATLKAALAEDGLLRMKRFCSTRPCLRLGRLF